MNALGVVLLATSLVSLSVYLVALHKLVTRPHRRGLVRTALSRVTAACLYIVIAMSTLAGHHSSAALSVGVFIFIQLLWQANAIADARLGAGTAKHSRYKQRSDYVTTPGQPNDPHIAESALANRTEEVRAVLGETVVDTAKLDDGQSKLRTWVMATAGVAVVALVLSVVAFGYAIHASNKADQNSQLIDSTAQQLTAIEIDTQKQQCVTDGHLLGFYSLDARKLYAGGPINYDQHYTQLQNSADHLRCGIAHVVPGT